MPLYDTLGMNFFPSVLHFLSYTSISHDESRSNLGSGAVEFILYHAEVSIVFVEEKKIPEVNRYDKISIDSNLIL